MVINKFVLVIGCAMLFALCACSRQQSDWQKARETNTPESYEQFLKKYPSGEFTAQAQARAKELVEERDWQKARDVDTLEAYQAFLKQYPEGKWTEEARIRVENFTLAQTPAGAAPGGTAGAPPGAAAAAPAPAPTAAAPTAAAAPARTAGAASQSKAGSYGIQLGAFKSGAAAANRRWAHLQKEYPKLLAGLSSTVAPKKTATGMLYRLQAFGVSEKRARAICKDLKAHSQACVVIRPAHA
ncbi:MAG: SPOR domain-containing protein [Steroidobacteraceae bacterium]